MINPHDLEILADMLDQCDAIRMNDNIVFLRNNFLREEDPIVGIEFDETNQNDTDPIHSFDLDEVLEATLDGNRVMFKNEQSFEMLKYQPFTKSNVSDGDQEKSFFVALSEAQIMAVSTQFSKMAGQAQYLGAKSTDGMLAQFDREFKLYRGIAKDVSKVIGFDGYMVEDALHPGQSEFKD